jgi:hypothetical protein
MVAIENHRNEAANGAALASFLSAGVGAAAMGLVILLDESGLFSAPALYAPAGGVSGRTTLAVVIWLIVWAVLHRRWKHREVNSLAVYRLALILMLVGTLLTLPPVWSLLG